jgi:hypothetical protein
MRRPVGVRRKNRPHRRALVAAVALVVGACVETAGPPTSVVTDEGLRATGDDGRVQAAGAPRGTFRTTPIAEGEVITVRLGDPVLVNAARFEPDADGDDLKVEVAWGDGAHDAVGCGPCRLSHVYARAGAYSLQATIHNRRNVDRGEVIQRFGVVVQGPTEPDLGPPPAPGPPLRFCHSIHAFIGPVGSETPTTCPSGATEFCDTAPIVATSSAQAQLACDTCLGMGLRCNRGNWGVDLWWWPRTVGINGYALFLFGPDPTGPAGTITGGTPTGRWAP